MANFFSADYWKALYFKAMGGQETAVDPNAMRGTFAGVASFTGALDQPEGAISGSFSGVAAFTADLDDGRPDAGGADGPDARKRKKRRVLWDYELKTPKDVFASLRDFLDRKNKKPEPEAKAEDIAAVVAAEPDELASAIASDDDDEDEIIMLLMAA